MINRKNKKQIEAVWVDIFYPKCKPILIGTCYRLPDQSNFVELFEEMCSNCADFNKSETIIFGDRHFCISATCLICINWLTNYDGKN